MQSWIVGRWMAVLLALLAVSMVAMRVEAGSPVAEVVARNKALGEAVKVGDAKGVTEFISARFRSTPFANKAAWVTDIGHWHQTYQVLQAIETSRNVTLLRNGRVAVATVHVGYVKNKLNGSTQLYGGSAWTEWAKEGSTWRIIYSGVPGLASPGGAH